MAAPPEVTTKNLQGKFSMNKSLCTRTDEILTLQGIGWLTRKAIGLAGITLHVTAYEKGGVSHVDIDQILTGGIKGTTEKRTLDWTERAHTDHIFGSVVGRTRYIDGLDKLEILTKLPSGSKDPEDVTWLQNERFEGKEGHFIHSWVENKDAGWTAEQIWGFEVVDGVRRHTRRVVVRKGENVERGWLVYDYVGELEQKGSE